jgi:hypothetical protein
MKRHVGNTKESSVFLLMIEGEVLNEGEEIRARGMEWFQTDEYDPLIKHFL